MGLREWITGLRRREDASAVREADERRAETDAERTVSSGDVEGMAASAEALERGGAMPADEPEPPR